MLLWGERLRVVCKDRRVRVGVREGLCSRVRALDKGGSMLES